MHAGCRGDQEHTEKPFALAVRLSLLASVSIVFIIIIMVEPTGRCRDIRAIFLVLEQLAALRQLVLVRTYRAPLLELLVPVGELLENKAELVQYCSDQIAHEC